MSQKGAVFGGLTSPLKSPQQHRLSAGVELPGNERCCFLNSVCEIPMLLGVAVEGSFSFPCSILLCARAGIHVFILPLMGVKVVDRFDARE